jgi:hypothetical protein
MKLPENTTLGFLEPEASRTAEPEQQTFYLLYGT